MSFWKIAGGIVLGAVIGGESTKKAAKTAAGAAEKGAAQISSAAAQAREDVQRLFPLARQDLFTGAGSAFDIFNQTLGGQQQAFSQGNINAQTTLGGGFNQVQNALLGLPVNQQAFAPQTVDIPQQIGNPITDPSIQGGFAQQEQQAFEEALPTAPITLLGGVQSNADLLGLVASGELGLENIDEKWFGELLDNSPNASLSNGIMNVVTSGGSIAQWLAGTGFNRENKNKLTNLIIQLRGLASSEQSRFS